uniref:Prolactin receptor n=1 Tax=Ditylenchus dipsaci TaxID=166011 RepID=A0A915CNR7_9BILA
MSIQTGQALPHASGSRLDPPLELNRNLTNWGLTYGERTPRKTWFKSEQNVSENGMEDRNGTASVQQQQNSPIANASNIPEDASKNFKPKLVCP